MKFGIYTIDDFNYDDKVVLCRVDLNSPLDRDAGRLRDTTRIRLCAPTINELSSLGAKLVLLAHQGGDLEYKNYYSTEPHAEVISNLIGKRVMFIDDVCGPAAREAIKRLNKGEILLLDNVRFMAEEMTLFETKLKLSREDQAKTIVIRKLAPLADLYVCDAFAALHRSQPTLVGFEELLPSAMGRLFEREIAALGNIAENPAHPCVYILGGAKIQDAFLMMGTALSSGAADKVLTGGLVSNIMLMAKEFNIGQSSVDFIITNNLMDFVKIGKDLLSKYADKIILPEDLAYVVDGRRVETDISGLSGSGLLTDIGTKTVGVYKEYIKQAKTIFINGPMGVFERPETEFGTREIWNASADSSAYSVIGGGDSVTAANRYDLAEKFSYVSTGGGALVQFLSGTEQPVLAALRASAVKFKSNR